MESSIAVFLMRQSACELLPTILIPKWNNSYYVNSLFRGCPARHFNEAEELSGQVRRKTLCAAFMVNPCLDQDLRDHPCGRGNSAISDA